MMFFMTSPEKIWIKRSTEHKVSDEWDDEQCESEEIFLGWYRPDLFPFHYTRFDEGEQYKEGEKIHLQSFEGTSLDHMNTETRKQVREKKWNTRDDKGK